MVPPPAVVFAEGCVVVVGCIVVVGCDVAVGCAVPVGCVVPMHARVGVRIEKYRSAIRLETRRVYMSKVFGRILRMMWYQERRQGRGPEGALEGCTVFTACIDRSRFVRGCFPGNCSAVLAAPTTAATGSPMPGPRRPSAWLGCDPRLSTSTIPSNHHHLDEGEVGRMIGYCRTTI